MVQGDKFTRHFRSPIDGSQLRQEGNALIDQSGNSFPVFNGVPILIPHLHGLFSSHFSISRETGRSLQAAPHAPITGYVMGCALVIEELGEQVPADFPVGALFDFHGRPAFVTTEGARIVNKLHIDMYGAHHVWAEVQSKLKSAPPYLLLDQQFPDHRFSTYYELLHFLGERTIDELQQGTDTHGHLDSIEEDNSAELTALNRDYFKSIADGFGIPLSQHPALEIGCGGGFLSRSIREAGASEVIGTDLRLSGFRFETWAEPGFTPGLANMFQWSYPENYFSLIAVRNNSAFVFARELDDTFSNFIKNCLRSIRDDGAVYLTFLTDGTGVMGDSGFTNLPVSTIVQWLHDQGAVILKMMRLGSMIGFWLSRNESLAENVAQHSNSQRRSAFQRYSASANCQRDQTLAIADFASEIALHCYRQKCHSVALWGAGIVSYQTWRMLAVLYPDIKVTGHIVRPSISKMAPSVLLTCTPQAAPGKAIHALADDAQLLGRRFGILGRFEQRRFINKFPGGPTFFDHSSSACAGPYAFLSGDHDQEISQDIAKVYFKGQIRGEHPDIDLGAEQAFEERMRFTFPAGFMGV